jgi:serine protease Do
MSFEVAPMTRLRFICGLAFFFVAGVAEPVAAQAPFSQVSQEVNQKLVKLFGSGGFRGLASYGTGILVSRDGYILTVANHILDTSDLRVHLYDGRRMRAKVVVLEPALDAALLKIDTGDRKEDLDLPHFDFQDAVKQPMAQPGDWVLAFSNQFQIATRDEPMTVQRGVVAAFTKLHGRRGIFDAAYTGDVYVVDAITNNPGAAGGALTTRSGRLLGIVGKELRNTLSETWLNYAVPVHSKVKIRSGDKEVTVALADFVDLGMKGQYKPPEREKPIAGPGGYHGIVFVPDVVERTPPFVDDVRPNSPAAKAGLRSDDLIVYVEGEPVASIKAFQEYIRKTQPGMQLKIEVRRGEKLVTIDLTLEDMPKKP